MVCLSICLCRPKSVPVLPEPPSVLFSAAKVVTLSLSANKKLLFLTKARVFRLFGRMSGVSVRGPGASGSVLVDSMREPVDSMRVPGASMREPGAQSFLKICSKRLRLSGCSLTKVSMCRMRFSSSISSIAMSMPVSSTWPKPWLTAVPNTRMVGLRLM